MPRYDYRCQACDALFELRMSMSEYAEGNKTVCPECGSSEVERTFTSVGVLTGSRAGGGAPAPSNCGHGGFT